MSDGTTRMSTTRWTNEEYTMRKRTQRFLETAIGQSLDLGLLLADIATAAVCGDPDWPHRIDPED